METHFDIQVFHPNLLNLNQVKAMSGWILQIYYSKTENKMSPTIPSKNTTDESLQLLWTFLANTSDFIVD